MKHESRLTLMEFLAFSAFVAFHGLAGAALDVVWVSLFLGPDPELCASLMMWDFGVFLLVPLFVIAFFPGKPVILPLALFVGMVVDAALLREYVVDFSTSKMLLGLLGVGFGEVLTLVFGHALFFQYFKED